MNWDETAAKRLGLTLRRLRTECALSQESLAFQAGITKNQLQLLEAGRSSGRKDATGPSNPRMSTLSGLASVLNVKVADLMDASNL